MKQIKMFPRQSTIYKLLIDNSSPVRELLIGGGAGGAKSTTGCTWLCQMAMQYPRTRWLMGRSELTALKLTTYNTFLDVAQDRFWLKYWEHFKLSNNNVVKFSNRSEIVLMDMKHYPGKDPNFDKLWSTEFTGGFVDEVNQLIRKAYEVVSTRIWRYKNEEYWLPGKLLMSCNPAKNRVYKEFYKMQKDWIIEKHKRFIQVLARQNPYIPKDYLDKLARMQEWPMKQRLYYGNREYDDTPGILFDYDDLWRMFKNFAGIQVDSWKYLIIDVGRGGDDLTTCSYWEWFRGRVLRSEEKSDMYKLADRIRQEARDRGVYIRDIIVDEDGVGGGLVDILWCTGFINGSSVIPNDEGFKPNYQNLKTQCYFLLADMIKRWLIYFDCPIDLQESVVDELHVVREINMDSDGKRQVISKKDVKAELGRSPDRGDNIMMRMLPILIRDPNFAWALKPAVQE